MGKLHCWKVYVSEMAKSHREFGSLGRLSRSFTFSINYRKVAVSIKKAPSDDEAFFEWLLERDSNPRPDG